MIIVQAGQVYGALKVVRRAKNAKSGNKRFMCLCSCGKFCSYKVAELRNGKRTKCHLCERMEQRKAAEAVCVVTGDMDHG